MSLTEAPPQKTLEIPHFSVAQAEDFHRLEGQLVREKEWFQGNDLFPVFQTDAAIEVAAADGTLVRVPSTPDFTPTARFFDNPDTYKPYIHPIAMWAMTRWVQLTFRELEECDIETRDIVLPITSMVRSQEYQDKLVSDPTVLATPDSTHCRAMAWDSDGAGYYRRRDDGRLVSVGVPERAPQQQDLVERLRDYGVEEEDLPVFDYESYDPRVNRAQMYAAELLMEREGAINFVLEFADQPNACLHMAANPAQ